MGLWHHMLYAFKLLLAKLKPYIAKHTLAGHTYALVCKISNMYGRPSCLLSRSKSATRKMSRRHPIRIPAGLGFSPKHPAPNSKTAQLRCLKRAKAPSKNGAAWQLKIVGAQVCGSKHCNNDLLLSQFVCMLEHFSLSNNSFLKYTVITVTAF